MRLLNFQGERLASRALGALAACGTRREPIHGGSMAASMPPTVPQAARTLHQDVVGDLPKSKEQGAAWLLASHGCYRLNTLRTHHLHWPLPAHHRGTLRGMDAA
ncbi:hypothetical protein XAP6164_730005 [Xanthomonas phaseoli pv. phaseoli]|nr:hypothetical protein XAP6164_730005 [Xanthomonas phaseoli pv. phaseoli]